MNPHKSMSNNTLLFALYRLGYRSRMTGHGFRGVTSRNQLDQEIRDVIEQKLILWRDQILG